MIKGNYKLDDVYLDLNKTLTTNKINSKFTSVEEVMKKSVIVPGFEQLEVVPKFYESERGLKANKKVISIMLNVLNSVGCYPISRLD